MRIFEKVKEKWLADDVNIYPPESRGNIALCFKNLGFTPSEEIFELYTVLGGMEDMGSELFRLWGLDEIVDENNSPEGLAIAQRFGVSFGDFLINSCCYRFGVNSNVNSEVRIDYLKAEQEPELRASTLTRFFEIMMQDPDKALL